MCDYVALLRTLPASGKTAAFLRLIRLHVDTILNRDIRVGEVAKENVIMDVVWPKGRAVNWLL